LVKELANIVELLRRRYGAIDKSKFIAQVVRGKSLFEFLVAVMLSQNTSDVNAIKAYERLKKKLSGEITPKKILDTDLEELVEAIKPAGMYRQRALRIKELAEIFSKPGFVDELLETISNDDVENARRILMGLPGIGAKTADVVLLVYFGKPTFPVDTHITRITKRLGYLDRTSYEDIRRFWMKILKPEDYLEAHLLLITHGRLTCKARNPGCSDCVLKRYCKYYLSRK